jgi:hypothetical protein
MENSVEEFERALEPITAAAGRDAIAQSWMVEVAANRPPWTPSGIELSTGDQISIFSTGRASIADQPNVWVGSHFSLWMRIGPQGEIFRAPGRSYTFTVGAGGQLYLSSLFPGDWADRHGALATNPRAYERVAGTLAVLVMRWRIDPRAGLDRLANYGSAGAAKKPGDHAGGMALPMVDRRQRHLRFGAERSGRTDHPMPHARRRGYPAASCAAEIRFRRQAPMGVENRCAANGATRGRRGKSRLSERRGRIRQWPGSHVPVERRDGA